MCKLYVTSEAIEYQLQAVVLTELECEKIMAKIFRWLSLDIFSENEYNKWKKHKELNEDTKTEDVREAEFLLWLKYICVNKENFVWENFDELVNKWNDIDKIISEKKLQVNWSHDKFEDISDFNVKIEGMKKELMNNASSMLDIGII
ncbi:hypothetical protein RhiirC2_864950 [Rhizophagus irregularis]|uniref:Uncharacterized protein n=1 Tax=Rhizophagus irregularis TaxID=588596 RepID=A0A2N1NF73_9GLOM|nr:hypothetical protein RhiirC2_864950 [Rhizophagus irregularis]